MTEPSPVPSSSTRSPAIERWLVPNALVLLALWLFAALHFHDVWPTLGVVFRDTDDMMRLVEVRDFLAGQGWYDLHQYRLDPPAEVPMHWSRLVDLPIALLYRLFALVFEPATAIRAAMFVWPALPFLPTLWAARRIAVALGGAWAAFPAVYLLATLGLVVAQFVPGRIDHHNMQIMLSMLLLAALTGPAGRRRGVVAAAIGAVGLAVGLEILPFLAITAAAIALAWVIDGDESGEAQAFGLTLAGATIAMAGATLPVSEWGRGACDALSISFVGLAAVGGVGLAGAAAWAPATRGARMGLLALVGVAAVAAYAWPEPACLRGPFGQLLPEVRRIWLDGVNEVQPWPRVFAEEHVGALLSLVTPVLGLLAGAWLARDPETRGSLVYRVVMPSLVVALAIGLGQIRTMVYANALAVPLVAAAIGLLGRRAEATGRSITVAVLAGSVLANCMVLQLALEQVVPASWRAEAAKGAAAQGVAGSSAVPSEGAACYTMTNFVEMAKLPRGLVAADIDIGPSILLATPHSVLSAPYHRMQRGILDANHMLNRPVEEGLAMMTARGVDYVAVCTAAKTRGTPGGILDRILAGRVPVGLEEMPGGGVIRVFRVHGGPVLTSR